MSEASAIAAVPSAAPAPRPLRGIDLYAEGNSFAETDGLAVERLFGADGIGFKDLIDIVNPLQHLPVVGTLYRALTGDELAPGSRILGGTLFGGIGGFVTALVNAVVENETGSDFGDKALALFQGNAAPQPRLAEAGAAETVAAATAAAPIPPAPDRTSFPIFAGPPRALPATSDAALALADSAPPDAAPARAAAPDIAYRMRDALDKYEALKKSRGGPSISGDF